MAFINRAVTKKLLKFYKFSLLTARPLSTGTASKSNSTFVYYDGLLENLKVYHKNSDKWDKNLFYAHWHCPRLHSTTVRHLFVNNKLGNIKSRVFSTKFRDNSARYSTMTTLEALNFDNLVLKSLPIDPVKENTQRQVKGACFSLVRPTPVKNPVTVAVSLPALNLLDLDEREVKKPEFAQYFSGSRILPGSETAAHCYCGHQFGAFAGQLGDGAAIYLGEVVNRAGERWEIQLKGAGKTPYSRTADGRKVLRSTIREFLCSEAMHHLGIPTTRAGSCITSDSTVIRDIFYNGNAIEEKCSIVLRIAPSFIRFGSFQICKPPDRETGREGPSVGRFDVLEQLTDYVIKNFYPQIHAAHETDKKAACTEMFREVVLRTARLVAKWQCVGWCHGVLNTDNMSILGLTIDYGPYGFMDRFDPEFICNNSDDGGRYTYERQPEVCKWNCEKLAMALGQMTYMDMTELYPIIELYDAEYDRAYMDGMRKKFGLSKEEPGDKELVKSFMKTMENTGADFTNSFRCLSKLRLPSMPEFEGSKAAVLETLLAQCCTLEEMIKANGPRMDTRQLQMFVMLMEMNPQLMGQLGAGRKAIHQEIKRMETVKELKEQKPEEKESSDRDQWTQWLDTYVQRLERDAEGEQADTQRRHLMDTNNPRFILRNYVAQIVIEAAERGDYSEVQHVLKLLQDPYNGTVDISPLNKPTDESGLDEASGSLVHSCPVAAAGGHTARAYDARPPSWATDLRVT